MVFGFGEGKIEIRLEKTIFAPGEIILGKVVLSLNNPKKARALRIVLKAEETIRQITRKGNVKTTNRIAYSFTNQLDGEKEYFRESTYDFEIAIPKEVSTENIGDQKLETALKLTKAFMSIFTNANTKWFLDASLDCPGFDINKKVQIQIN